MLQQRRKVYYTKDFPPSSKNVLSLAFHRLPHRGANQIYSRYGPPGRKTSLLPEGMLPCSSKISNSFSGFSHGSGR